MVRYSKLPFRLLLHSYAVDVIYTPMILAHEFIRSSIARDSDFTTCPAEQPSAMPIDDRTSRRPALIAQFASSDPEEFARAAEMIAPWVDGVDLNCGCPQSWAMKEGIGCSLMGDADTVAAIVSAAKKRLSRVDGGRGRSVSVKIRVHKDLAVTEHWMRTVEAAGVDYFTVHGRLKSQRSSTPPDYEAIRSLKNGAGVPIFANGDAYSLEDVKKIAEITDADGVMAARGLLENPTMFAGDQKVPVEAVRKFLESAVRSPIPFQLVLHHVGEMTARMEGMGKREKRRLMECADMMDLIDFIEGKWGLR
ncbi:FMN-linked oxidoreductase [Polychaeton citri CBS 116435]|uniref:tRNA-dihydrouridine synthase n=1 Tax=Polychaeton citri CBS 116435 TaxID=1314669 RepID=A0A9P4UTA2_9PEZI|nr:FMN-linked oxidoreductase [Polychaeton citri CBS 116435]